jgi:hypothetical protein
MLARGLSLDVAPRPYPQNAAFVIVASTTRVLPIAVGEIRSEIARILKRTYLHKPNLYQRERAILRELQDRGDMYILPPNSGNTMAILDCQYYTRKINTIFAIPVYKIVTCILIEKVYMQANNLIQQCSV